jgi:hypothetical protein
LWWQRETEKHRRHLATFEQIAEDGARSCDISILFEAGKETNIIWNPVYFGGRENQKSIRLSRADLNRYLKETACSAKIYISLKTGDGTNIAAQMRGF